MSIAATMCRWLRISICSSGGRKSFPRWGVILIDLQQMRTDGKIMGYQGSDFRRPQQFPGRRQREDPQRHPPSGIVGAPPGTLSGTAPVISPGGGCALPGLPGPLTGSHLAGPVSAAPPGDAIRHRAALLPGGGWRLTRPTVRSSQPLTYPLVRLETAGVAASTSLRRSRKAGAARMDAG